MTAMSTPKEIFLELLKPDGQPERQLRQYEALSMCLTDPINTYLRGNRRRGTVSHNRWAPPSLSGGRPRSHSASQQALTVCQDVTRWRETVHAPDLNECGHGWEECRAAARPPAARTTRWPALWARASSSSATSSWALRARSPLCMNTPTRCMS